MPADAEKLLSHSGRHELDGLREPVSRHVPAVAREEGRDREEELVDEARADEPRRTCAAPPR